MARRRKGLAWCSGGANPDPRRARAGPPSLCHPATPLSRSSQPQPPAPPLPLLLTHSGRPVGGSTPPRWRRKGAAPGGMTRRPLAFRQAPHCPSLTPPPPTVHGGPGWLTTAHLRRDDNTKLRRAASSCAMGPSNRQRPGRDWFSLPWRRTQI
ncbi:hypothetical protein PVAP13_1KG423800 [Panicum virgatum]|uniref:Uncharacterized protein n=1 Tax=Panicum virgatum TaxID=38727 RepID=A0A8T0XTW0_PANVG|nr:hypothetical protein PVAP13_1KG423800 [Panicum virgatum]